MSVVTLDADGHNAKIIPLGIAHGDVEPPRLFATGATLAAGILEPAVNGRSLRLAKITNGEVTWGATLHGRGRVASIDIALRKKGSSSGTRDGPASSIVQFRRRTRPRWQTRRLLVHLPSDGRRRVAPDSSRARGRILAAYVTAAPRPSPSTRASPPTDRFSLGRSGPPSTRTVRRPAWLEPQLRGGT